MFVCNKITRESAAAMFYMSAIEKPPALCAYLSLVCRALARPEEVRARGHPAALVRLLQQLGARQGTLGTQRLVILLPETRHLLQRARDESDGGQLCLAVRDLVLVQGERLQHAAQHILSRNMFLLIHRVWVPLKQSIVWYDTEMLTRCSIVW